MGSWGDLFPFVGLGRALVAREHEVRLAASPAWEDVVTGAGVPFVGVGRWLGFEEMRRHPEILQRVPFGLRHALGRFVFDQIDELTCDLRDAMAGADLVVTHPAHVAAHNVAEHLGGAAAGGDGVPRHDPELEHRAGRHPGGPVAGTGGSGRERPGVAECSGGDRSVVRWTDQPPPPPARPAWDAGGAAGAAPGGRRRSWSWRPLK
jgi:hypothetical protein